MSPRSTSRSPDVDVNFRDPPQPASDPMPSKNWANNGSGGYVAVGTVEPASAEMSAQVSYLDTDSNLVEVAGTPTTIPKGYQWAFLFSKVPIATAVTVQATGTTDNDAGNALPVNTTTA